MLELARTYVLHAMRTLCACFLATHLLALDDAAIFLSPPDGAIDVPASITIRFRDYAGTKRFRVKAGLVPGAADLYDSGILPIQQLPNGVSIDHLPGASLIYIIFFAVDDDNDEQGIDELQLRTFDGNSYAPPVVVYPQEAGDYDQGRPVAWKPIDWATAYRLTIGRSPEGSELFDSGQIAIPAIFPTSLPDSILLHGTLYASIGDRIESRHFVFTAMPYRFDRERQIEAVKWLTGYVRRSAASSGNTSRVWSNLRVVCSARNKKRAACSDYATSLVSLFVQMRIAGEVATQNVAFINNRFDVHTFNQWRNGADEDWMILDPTFGFVVTDLGGNGVDALEMQRATLMKDWSQIRFVPVTDGHDYQDARLYYLDYPLLFLFVQKDRKIMIGPSGIPQLDYLELVDTGFDTMGGAHVIYSPSGTEAEVSIDNAEPQAKRIWGGFSVCFPGSPVRLTGPSQGAKLFRLKRFVFQR